MIWMRNLGFRLTLVLGLVLSGVIGLLIYLMAVYHRTELMNEISFSTHRLAATVEARFGYDMLNHNWQEIERSMDAIGKQKGIEKIRIFNKVGKIVFSSDESEIGSMVDKQAEACYQCHGTEIPLVNLKPLKGSRIFNNPDGHRILAVIESINNKKACASSVCHVHPENQRILGVLDIAVSLEEMDERLARSAVMLIIGLCLFVVSICSLVGVFIYRFVRRPIKRLLEGINKVAAGDFNHSINVRSSDEIGQLTVAFNEMTDKLRYHIKKLTEKQEQLLHSQKLACLGKMAAGVAHELNSPLTVILNDSSLLLRDFPDGSSEKKDLEVIMGEAKRCGEIIHNLLEFTRLERPAKKLININTVAQEALELIKHQAILTNIDVTFNLSQDLPRIKIDDNQIKQVFLDIMTNAIQSMRGGGDLTITSNLSKEPNFLEMNFSDTGCGISEENINKIFQPFFSTKDAKNGTGLGLAICYEIIQEHGGKIAVTSNVVNGTTFSIKLPLIQADE